MGVDPKGPITAGHPVSTYLHPDEPDTDFDHSLFSELWPICNHSMVRLKSIMMSS